MTAVLHILLNVLLKLKEFSKIGQYLMKF